MAKTRETESRSVQKKHVAKAAETKPVKRAVVVKKAAPAKKAAPVAPAKKAAPAVIAKKATPAAPAKKTAPVASAKKVTPAKKAVPTPPAKKAVPVAQAVLRELPDARKQRFSKTDLKQFQMDLLAMRDRITNQSGAMKTAALQRSDEINLEEDGTDAFLRLQTLEQVGSQQAIITKINEALHAISKGKYGVCDTCGALINKARLAVLPFARNCIKCQSEMERMNRYGRFR